MKTKVLGENHRAADLLPFSRRRRASEVMIKGRPPRLISGSGKGVWHPSYESWEEENSHQGNVT